MLHAAACSSSVVAANKRESCLPSLLYHTKTLSQQDKEAQLLKCITLLQAFTRCIVNLHAFVVLYLLLPAIRQLCRAMCCTLLSNNADMLSIPVVILIPLCCKPLRKGLFSFASGDPGTATIGSSTSACNHQSTCVSRESFTTSQSELACQLFCPASECHPCWQKSIATSAHYEPGYVFLEAIQL